MQKAKCRVCGAEFSPCKGVTGIPPEQQPFNWRKICCSVQCGSRFINDVLESRGLTSEGTPVQATTPASPEPVVKPKRQRKPKPEPVESATEETE
jgi:hypothetical protein